MQRRNAIILAVAVLFGLLAVYLANTYFSGVEEQQQRAAREQLLTPIVVASQDMEFGAPLTEANIRMVNWPQTSIPVGAYRKIEDALKDGRVALGPITIGEAIIASRVSGADGRASISYNLPEGMRAVSIPVSAVTGVSGFIMPGDVVDVLLTRQMAGDGAESDDKMTNVLMENVRVLAIDQLANEKNKTPKVGKTAVVMVDLHGAQKLTLARELGTLSLALRNVENQDTGMTTTVSTRDLGRRLYIPAKPAAAPAQAYLQPPAMIPRPASAGQPIPTRPSGPSMLIVRGTQGTTYDVSRYGGW